MSLKNQWNLLRSGNQNALEVIYKTTIASLIDYGCRFVQDRQMVEDAIHDTFVGIWKNRSSINETDNPTAYLMLSVKRNIIRKSNKIKKYGISEEPSDIDFQSSLSIEDMIINSEDEKTRSAQLKKGFDTLSNRQQEAIYLKYYQNKSYEEVGEIMEMNYQSVRNLVFRAITALRKEMTIIILILIQ